MVDDSNKRPDRTVLLVIPEANGKTFSKHGLKVTLKTAKLVAENGATVVESLDELAEFLNTYKPKVKTIE